MYRNPPVCLFINFQMSKLDNYSEEYADHSLDNLEELQEQGWIPGQPCSILVDEHGDLGPCLPLPSININHLLLGLGIITLLICWTFYYSKRIYRCKFLPQLAQLSYFPSTNVLFPRKIFSFFFLSSSYYASRYRHTSTRTSRPLQKTSHQHDSDWDRFSRYQHSVSFTNYPSSTISSPPAEQLPSGHKTRRSAPFP